MNPSWWNSLELVTRYNFLLQSSAIALMFLSFLVGAISLQFNKRITFLQNQKEMASQDETKNHEKLIKTLNAELIETKNKLTITDKGVAKLIKIDSQTPARNVKLPASGKFTYVKTDNSANTVKITTSVPGQTLLNGLDSYELSVQGESVTLEFSGSNWFKIY